MYKQKKNTIQWITDGMQKDTERSSGTTEELVGRSFDNSVRFGMKQKRNSPILCNIQWAEIIFNNARATITFFVFIAILIPFSCLYQQQIVHQIFFFYFNKGERRVNRFPKLMREQTCYITAHKRHGWWFFWYK